MKPRLRGNKYEDITRHLQDLERGLFLVRETVSLTPVAVAANSAVEQTFTVPRLTTNDSVLVEYTGAQTAGIGLVSARVSAADTLAITYVNPTAGSLTPASGNHRLIRME